MSYRYKILQAYQYAHNMQSRVINSPSHLTSEAFGCESADIINKQCPIGTILAIHLLRSTIGLDQ